MKSKLSAVTGGFVLPYLRRHLWRKSRPWVSIISDGAGWVLDEEAGQLQRLLSRAGWTCSISNRPMPGADAVFFTDHFMASGLVSRVPDRIQVSLAYFHGPPGIGIPEFDKAFESFRSLAPRIHRVQVSYDEMKGVCRKAGFRDEQIWKIPIAIDLERFQPLTADTRRRQRQLLDIPDDAVVVGSFQKDGNGWGAGDTPKLIKGPDVFLEVIARLRSLVPRLHVLLTGPARGYVMSGLRKLDVRFTHLFLHDASQISSVYHALDLYLVCSRQEGGPKAVLESMASGVQIVSTKVGQAQELIIHGENGFLAAVEDVESLTKLALHALTDSESRDHRIRRGLETAKLHTYNSQLETWLAFFN